MCSAFDSLILMKQNGSEVFFTKFKKKQKLVHFMCLNFTVFKSVG